MLQRYALGSARAATGVQNQSNIRGRRLSGRNPPGSVQKMNVTTCAHLDREDRYISVRSSTARFFRSLSRTKQDPGTCIVQVETELVKGVTGIERSSGPCQRGSKESDDRRKSVGQNHRDPAIVTFLAASLAGTA